MTHELQEPLQPSTSTGESDWVLVPREATTVMFKTLTRAFAGSDEGRLAIAQWALGSFREDYAAMLASAPAPDTKQEADELWRDLALQFDGHRIEALSLLRYVSESRNCAEATSRASEIKAFLSKPPLSGEAVLAQRLSALFPSPVTSEAWQPIETAPKDGTRILGWNFKGCTVMQWTDAEPMSSDSPGLGAGWLSIDDGGAIPACPGYSTQAEGQPTHWQPRPSKPLQATGEAL